MAISTPFSSASEAEDAYFGSGSGDGSGENENGNDNQGSTWGQLQRSTTLGSSWVLAYQAAVNSDRRRWFAIRMSGGTLTAIKANGSVYESKESDTLGQLPHYDTESDARDAFEAWAEGDGGDQSQNGENGENGQGDTSWGEWAKVRKVGPWFIFGRTSSDGSEAQFIVTGKRDGATVYLAPAAKIVETPHIFAQIEAAKQALDAYQQSVADGDTPPGMQPNGNSPDTSTVREAVSKVVRSSQSQTKTQERIVERLGGQKVVLGIAAVGGLALVKYQEGKK